MQQLLSMGRHLLWGVLALLLLIEEWLWEQVKTGLLWLAQWRLWRWVETQFRALPAWAALVGLTLPWLALLPLKFMVLWLLVRGHFLSGLLLLVITKVGGTTLAVTVFTWTKPQLLELRWFAQIYVWLVRWLDLAHAWLHQLDAYRYLKRWQQRLRSFIAQQRSGPP